MDTITDRWQLGGATNDIRGQKHMRGELCVGEGLEGS